MSDLDDLYQEIILDHNKRPRNFRAMKNPSYCIEADNPLCGDELTLYFQIENERITDISFQGEGCAISKASASLLTVMLMGKKIDEATREFKRIVALLTEDREAPVDLLEVGDIASLTGVRRFPARIKCATLAWHALNAALEGRSSVTTE